MYLLILFSMSAEAAVDYFQIQQPDEKAYFNLK